VLDFERGELDSTEQMILKSTRSYRPRKGEERISKMPSKAHQLLIGNSDGSQKSSSLKSRGARRWSVVKKRQESRKARLFMNVARILKQSIPTPALQIGSGPTREGIARKGGHPASIILDDDPEESLVTDIDSEPCMSAGSVSTLALQRDRETYPIDPYRVQKEKKERKEMTVAILLPKCALLNRAQGKVLLLRVRTKKEASNLTTVIKRNITAANAQLLLNVCRNNTVKLDEVLNGIMSEDDIQPIRKGGCCEAIGKRAIEDAVKQDNLASVKQLLDVLHPLCK
jgi:hypothetical protein